MKGENVKEFMLAIGAPADKAANAEHATTTVNCTRNGEYYVVNITGSRGNSVQQKFAPVEPFTETFAAIGKQRQAVASIVGNQVIIEAVEPGLVKETREVNGTDMTFTLSKEGCDIVAKRYFKKQV